MPTGRDITMILQGASAGEPAAVRELFVAVYDDLRARARAYLAGERADHTLQPTALFHEAYMRLIDQNRVVWQNRAHRRANIKSVARASAAGAAPVAGDGVSSLLE